LFVQGDSQRGNMSDCEGNLLTLLCLSRTYGRIHRPGELPVEFAGNVSLEAAADFPGGLSLGGAPGDVGAGAGAAAHPGDCDGVDGAVQRPVAAAVEPVPEVWPLLAGIGLVPLSAANAASLRYRPRWEKAHDGLGRADRSDTVAAGQARSDVPGDGQRCSRFKVCVSFMFTSCCW
jgi:hypothetical protein